MKLADIKPGGRYLAKVTIVTPVTVDEIIPIEGDGIDGKRDVNRFAVTVDATGDKLTFKHGLKFRRPI